MEKKQALILLFLLISLLLGSCILVDYFSEYTGKNLVGHTDLTAWSASHSAPYMDYAEVTAAVAGTTGLPDEAALIYRLENENLFPDGDFEASTAAAPPNAAYWTDNGGTATYEIVNSGHALHGNALRFNQASDEEIAFSMNNLLDTAYSYKTYVIRFCLDCDNTGDYIFFIDDSTGTDSTSYIPNISSSSTHLEFPEDFSTVPQTEFVIHANDTEVFRINRSDSEYVQAGYIDNIRVVKSDQSQELSILLPYTDESRVDNLELLSGWYRFSIYVKADPETGSGNRFDSDSVTLGIKAIDDDGAGGSSKAICFNASDYSSFSDWTQIYIDANLQIDAPVDASSNVIELTVSPCCTVSGALGVDAGSILISTPSLEFSPTGAF